MEYNTIILDFKIYNVSVNLLNYFKFFDGFLKEILQFSCIYYL